MPIPRMRDLSMDFDQHSDVQTADPAVGDVALGAGLPGLRPAFGVNVTAELLNDLLSATDLVAPEQLAQVRARALQGGTFAQALVDEGVASNDGLARILAARFELPLVDLAETGIDPE